MADYNKLKVTELKEELKKRGIPTTGLKLKQQYVDKLLEADATVSTDLQKPADLNEDGAQGSPQTQLEVHQSTQEDTEDPKSSSTTELPNTGDPKIVDKPHDEVPLVDKIERNETSPGVPSPTASLQPEETDERPSEKFLRATTEHQTTQDLQLPATSQNPPIDATSHNRTVTPSTLQKEVHEDSKKRKRRSVTPPPTTEDVAQKKARLSGVAKPIERTSKEDEAPIEEIINNTPVERPPEISQGNVEAPHASPIKELVETHELEGSNIQEANGVDANRQADGNNNRETKTPSRKSTGTNARFKELVQADTQSSSPPRNENGGDESRSVTPSLHPATSSLYIRNLKRPLQLPALKAHLTALATPLNSSPQSDIVKEFYLDGIKTHALVTFVSVSAASRVRSALHNTRWPEEKSREALWVDFVPDEKVEGWIEMEKTSGGSMTRWEVVYDDTTDEVQTTLQEVGTRRKFSTQLPKGTQATDYGETIHPDRASLVHPERAAFVSRDGHRRPSRPEKTSHSSGNGFQALDDLFLSTNTKPKLYFKPVADGLAASRGERFRDLLQVPEMRGRGADQEMRRYSFEDGDYWIDKGPEFGYSRGGHRGRGGARGSSYLGRKSRLNDGWRGRGY